VRELSSTPDDVLRHLYKWRNDSTRLLIQSVSDGFETWCIGTLAEIAQDELRFTIESIKSNNFFLSLRLRLVKFRWLPREEQAIFPPGLPSVKLAHCLEIFSEPDGKIMLGEISSP
jgi:hypothetical protein